MMDLNLSRKLLFLLAILILTSIAGCNIPSNTAETPALNVTQAYQTVAARLTEAIAQTPSPTANPSPTQGDRQMVTPSPTNQLSFTPTVEVVTSTAAGDLCDQAAPGAPIDVTVPDGTKMEPGQQFTKIWRLQNVGTCTWTEEYALVFFSGDQLGALPSIPLSGQVSPGQTVDLSADMEAPEEPGTYRGNWKLRNDSGVLFGIGPSGGSAFWVEIEVVQPPPGSQTIMPPTTVTPTPSPTVDVQIRGSAALTPGDQVDLDSGQINPGSGADLALEAADSNHMLVSLASATMAVFGRTQPTLNDCQIANLSADPLVVEDNLVSGIYLCYRTNMALPGWALVNGFDSETATLSLDILTWAIP